MVKIGIAGCCGKMSKMIIDVVLKTDEAEFIGGFERRDSLETGNNIISSGGENTGLKVEKDISDIIEKIDVLIDFTTTESTLNNLKFIEKYKKKIVIGTTGFTVEDLKIINDYSKNIPIVFSPNMSIGVNLLFKIVKDVAKIIGSESDIEIVEYHHNQKKDAPSGTALKLAENIAETLNLNLKEVIKCGREGNIGKRPDKEIGVLAVRAGDIVGEHNVMFAMDGERIELVHKAHSRMTFAKGAVKAAVWISDKKKGLYNMNDVLGI